MGIIKKGKNITINVTDKYNLIVSGKLLKKANKLNFESTKADLILLCGKKIIAYGEEK